MDLKYFFIFTDHPNKQPMKFYSFLLAMSLLLSSCRKETTVSTKDPREITSTTVQTGGYIEGSTKNKVIKRGVCWAETPSPGAPNSDNTNGHGLGEFDSFVTGLKPATHYYMRAYAFTEAGYFYGNQVSFTTLTPPDPSILQYNGSYYQVYTIDQYYPWGLTGANTTATSTTDGDYNTTQMLKSYSYGAAAACATLNALGYSDWFLPSKDQLNAMYKNRTYYNFIPGNYYWSSTQYNQDLAWVQEMSNGTVSQNYKTYYGYCRCIRKK
jgi:hypothetical protein